ncbi:MAG: hypothetical protein NTU83_07755, partial [Candidatus Hydrogenedentes bacterium]|nr:hypothetical protein [Candidatus Hydrogenedentota bacterium]
MDRMRHAPPQFVLNARIEPEARLRNVAVDDPRRGAPFRVFHGCVEMRLQPVAKRPVLQQVEVVIR